VRALDAPKRKAPDSSPGNVRKDVAQAPATDIIRHIHICRESIVANLLPTLCRSVAHVRGLVEGGSGFRLTDPEALLGAGQLLVQVPNPGVGLVRAEFARRLQPTEVGHPLRELLQVRIEREVLR